MECGKAKETSLAITIFCGLNSLASLRKPILAHENGIIKKRWVIISNVIAEKYKSINILAEKIKIDTFYQLWLQHQHLSCLLNFTLNFRRC